MHPSRWRGVTWMLVVANAVFLVWLVAVVDGRASKSCYPGDDSCVRDLDQRWAVSVGIVASLWVLVVVVLVVVWFLDRSPRAAGRRRR